MNNDELKKVVTRQRENFCKLIPMIGHIEKEIHAMLQSIDMVCHDNKPDGWLLNTHSDIERAFISISTLVKAQPWIEIRENESKEPPKTSSRLH